MLNLKQKKRNNHYWQSCGDLNFWFYNPNQFSQIKMWINAKKTISAMSTLSHLSVGIIYWYVIIFINKNIIYLVVNAIKVNWVMYAVSVRIFIILFYPLALCDGCNMYSGEFCFTHPIYRSYESLVTIQCLLVIGWWNTI